VEFVAFHVYAPAAEHDTFRFEPQPLLNRGIAAQLDFASGTKHAMPGKIESSMECGDDLSRGPGITCGPGDRTIRRHSSSRDRADSSQYLLSHRIAHGSWYLR
jgi:hypothetical protein